MENGTTNRTNPLPIQIPEGAIDAYISFLSFVVIFGTIGNVLVLLVFLRSKTKTSTDWFIIFIAVMDLISSIINVPVYITFVTPAWYKYGNDAICKAHMFVSQAVALAGTFLICGLAFERYSKVCKTATARLTKNRAKWTSVGIVIVNIIFSVPSIFIYKNSVYGSCLAIGISGTLVNGYYMFVFATFIIAFVIVVFSYARVSMTITQSNKALMNHGDPYGTSSYTASNPGKLARVFKKTNSISPISEEPIHKTLDIGSVSGSTFSKNPTGPPPATRPEPCASSTSDDHVSGHISGVVSKTQETQRSSQQVNTLSSVRAGIENRRTQQITRTTKIAFCVCMTFVLTWLPPWIGFVLYWTRALPNTMESTVFHMFSRMTYLINTFMNPIFYIFLHGAFRNKLMALFKVC